ncbi:4-hydroxybenzoyl-CoA thioesterase [Chryseobacterium piperi]|uniref:4-hydroxybenzoyl-CoA thioesterase n=1 Tax=Chryseobacterium piperi TaxID=558152 RepID=A0A086B5M5_9FLAO|nr:acyl-CoA thioesterase [Chryseobacterium piperi]ASW75630.1 4-hydroxybenzoyl-CoA thioesterase [Chryseobacterium piperi]KFF24239.1 4-hydroxybenzoyl-CoA thioesterase [Chryseobacterium piperi]
MQSKEKNISFSEEIRVRFNETDPLGIVWHGHYIAYFEDGREAFGRAHGLSYLDIQKAGYLTPIVKSTCEHFLPLKYGETFRIETTFVNSVAAKLIFKYELFNQDNKLVCSGETIQVFLDSDGNLCLYNPVFFQEWKDKMKLS